MKYISENINFLKCFIIILFLFISGCTSTQSSVYKDGDETWKVNVVKKAALNEEFICTINGTEVLKDSFPLIGDNFQKTGSYKGKKVMMNGYRTSSSGKDINGNVQTNDTYQIRVFINDVLVDKFDF